MINREEVTFSRNAEAIMIPSGERVLVPEGAQGTITQSLGGSYTVVVNGNMFRIEGKDADALGLLSRESNRALELLACARDALQRQLEPERRPFPVLAFDPEEVSGAVAG